jgi:predicted alpha-1,6-mannanase (GH76 family)
MRRALVMVTTACVLAVFTTMTAMAGVQAIPPRAGLATLMTSYGSTYKDLIGGRFWQAAVAQSTVEAYDQATGATSYLRDIADTYGAYVNGPNPASRLPDFEDGYTDDTAWWGLAWLRAYLITKNADYLRVAEADAHFIHRQWDTDTADCGGRGGVRWAVSRSVPGGKLAISNALFLELTAWLHNVLHGDTMYLGWAEAEWSWLTRSGLITSSYLVWNGFSKQLHCSYQGPYWSYDMGSVIAGLAQLYAATHDASLLTEAERIARAAIGYLAHHGVLAETCESTGCNADQQSFKGIFVGDIRMLASTARTSAYDSFLRAQRDSVEAHDTSSGAKFGLIWAGPISRSCPASSAPTSVGAAADICTVYTQASAEDAIVAALPG